MSDSLGFLLAIGGCGVVCGLWAWLQVMSLSGDAVDDAEARCGLNGCEICRGLGRCDRSP